MVQSYHLAKAATLSTGDANEATSGEPEVPAWYGSSGAVPEPKTAIEMLTRYVMCPDDPDAPSAEQIGVAMSLEVGQPADAFEVGHLDAVEAELDRM